MNYLKTEDMKLDEGLLIDTRTGEVYYYTDPDGFMP